LAVNRYLTCPEQYRLYYLEQLRPKVPSAALVFGQLVHQALAVLFQHGGDSVKCFQDAWGVLKDIPLEFSHRESWDKLRASGEALLAKFAAKELPRLSDIASVEKPFRLSITRLGLPFIGVIDLVGKLNGTRTVVDWKTAGSAPDGHEAALSDQLTAYQLAEPEAEQVALCVLVKTKEPQIEWHCVSRTGAQLGEYLAKVGYVSQELNANRFYKRFGLWCTWCDYLPVCLGDTRKVQESLLTVP